MSRFGGLQENFCFKLRSVHDGCSEGCSDAFGRNSNEGAGSFQRFLPKGYPFAEVDLEVSHPAASWPAQFKSFEFMFMCMLPERRDQQFASYIQA